MNWLGKILGAIFGYLLLGPVGAFIGFLIGHYFDKGLSRDWRAHLRGRGATQQVFFDSVFSVMGNIAKADGRVSERELQLARNVMEQMGLKDERKREAMRQFNEGKKPTFSLDATLQTLRSTCREQHLLRLFLEMQVQIAYVDGMPKPHVKELLQHISQQLGFGGINFAHVEAMLYGPWRGQQSQHYQRRTTQPGAATLTEAYAILEIQSNADEAEVKRAYRRKMHQNHPDKLLAKGLPKEMIEMATAKTQQIKAAYEQIKQARGFSK